MNKWVMTAVLAASVGLSGCATVLNGTKQPVEFDSDPQGATIVTAQDQTCVTPCAFEMRRGDDSMITFTAEGYQPVTVYVQSRTGAGMAGNLLAGGIIGGVVDASNGAANHLYPDPVWVRMVPVGQTGEAVLLDKDGEVIETVAEYNVRVAEDVREGLVEQGLYSSVDVIPPAN